MIHTPHTVNYYIVRSISTNTYANANFFDQYCQDGQKQEHKTEGMAHTASEEIFLQKVPLIRPSRRIVREETECVDGIWNSMEDSQVSGAELSLPPKSLQHTHFQYNESEVRVVTMKIMEYEPAYSGINSLTFRGNTPRQYRN